MNRSRGYDRQQTNFYWPDEADLDDSHTSKTKRRAERSAQPAINNNHINNNNKKGDVDINAKERFHKQLTSGIEFFDNVDAKTPEARRRRLKKIDNVNLNNSDSQYQPEKKKLETFTSKIEFYDYVDDLKPKSENNVKTKETTSVNKNVVNDDIVKKPTLEHSNKKRITFQNAAMEKATKGILKNSIVNDGKKSVNSIPPRRGLMLSKSVENISKLAKSSENLTKNESNVDEKPPQLIKIIRDVKNLNLSSEKPQSRSKKIPYRDDEFEDEFYSRRGGTERIGNRRFEGDRYDDYDRGYKIPIEKDWDEDLGAPRKKFVNERIGRKRDEEEYRSKRPSEYDDFNDDYINERPDRRVNGHSHRPSGRPPYDDFNDEYDNRRRAPPKDAAPRSRKYLDYNDYNLKPLQKNPVKRREYEDDDYIEESVNKTGYNDRYENNSRSVLELQSSANRNTQKPISRKQSDDNEQFDNYSANTANNTNGDGHKMRLDSPARSQNVTNKNSSNELPRSRNRYHQNLQSSIFFGDDAPPQPNRPLSVRSSAVCRVGVGLPDI